MRVSRTVLHVPFTYFPDSCGGTEVYVHGLAKSLERVGWRSVVAAPAIKSGSYVHDGVSVHRFAISPTLDISNAYGEPDKRAAEGFAAIVDEVSPAIVHLHAHTSAVSAQLVGIAHEAGAKVVFTYHTPTVSCSRGTMMLFGRTPCDGKVDWRRCAVCTMSARGLPRLASYAISSLPIHLSAALSTLTRGAAASTALRMPGLIASRGNWFARLIRNVDAVVAVCNWVKEVLERNGVPKDKLLLSRQGIGNPVHRIKIKRLSSEKGNTRRIAFFGRLDPTKGLDILVSALRQRPTADVRLDVYAINQAVSYDGSHHTSATTLATDSRVRFCSPVPPESVVDVMSDYDFVAVPSRWLETGPLVALEAFAARVPILGANLGGISELVRDGVNGLLVPPNDTEAWAKVLDLVASRPKLSDELRRGIQEPRTMDDVARDMSGLYCGLVPQDV